MQKIQKATLVLANHRPEAISAAHALMCSHDAIILEEPPDPNFSSMLNDSLSIDAYLEEQEMEYPEFSRQMAERLREYYREGIRLYQVEPFIEHLLSIHERFAEGESPSDIPAGTILQQVYQSEKRATAALIHFYDTSLESSFEETLEAVKRFARSDASRFALRDHLRAEAIAKLLPSTGRTYIEAGPIHYPLWWELRRRLPNGYPLKVNFLMADAVRELGGSRHLYGPGDLLTLLYRFHPKGRFRRESLLAAQALIYNKLIVKEEIVGSNEKYPHTRDELYVGEITDQLSLNDCRILYPLIRNTTTPKARIWVKRYLSDRRNRLSAPQCEA